MRATATRRAQIEPFDPGDPGGEYGLSERGRVQARLLGARLARETPPDLIYAGESDRHAASAEVVARTIAAVTDERPAVEAEPGLNDLDWTVEALRTCAEADLAQVAWIRRWIDGDLAIAESVGAARERLAGLADRLVARHDPTDHVLLVTSTVPVQLLACGAMGTAIEETRLSLANAAITRLVWEGDRRVLRSLDDAAHLPGALVTRDGFVDRD